MFYVSCLIGSPPVPTRTPARGLSSKVSAVLARPRSLSRSLSVFVM
ncbi:hypothetical protein FOVG_01388 [Fusarium oxysporum f. sp. pisi HDV247]|uniref:Uncharacterized protein n=1 Tax=Fusarium oxysporum f. sp. pisi HDV247 TaxID=1080344 RepID=W9Q831_FUSOX|nr:hypothetical protein FOVG_01388 [Fusarium oxysporum f. sp. pisi HDV247]